MLPTRLSARRAAWNGITASLPTNSARLGRSSALTLTSRNGVGACWLTTRIISSGVTPLARSDATKEPALVPT